MSNLHKDERSFSFVYDMGCCFSRVDFKFETQEHHARETIKLCPAEEFDAIYDQINTMTLPSNSLLAYEKNPMNNMPLGIAFRATKADSAFLQMKNDPIVLRKISTTFGWAFDHEDSILVVKCLDVGALTPVRTSICHLQI